LMRLRAPKREAFVLWALEGMEPEQVAEVTGASLSATRSRIFYAQKELRQMADRDPYLKDLLCAKVG
jgi:DNA-directed RNA polymerase specialized sigma24 family protein